MCIVLLAGILLLATPGAEPGIAPDAGVLQPGTATADDRPPPLLRRPGPTDEALELAGRMFPRSVWDRVVRDSARAVARQMRDAGAPGSVDDIEAEVIPLFLPYDEMQPILAAYFDGLGSGDDLRRFAALLRSPDGERLAQALVTLSQTVLARSQQRALEGMPSLRQRLLARARPDGQALVQAAARGDLTAVRAALDAGVLPDAPDRSGTRALLAAVSNERRDVARLLLERGADANAHSPKGWTALMYAALSGDEALVQLLLDRGADPASREQILEMSALEMAVQRHREGVARLLRDAEERKRQQHFHRPAGDR